MSKRCSRCGAVKLVSEFHVWNQRDGRQAYCRPCRKDYDAAYHRRTWGEKRLEQKRTRHREFAAWYRSLKEGRPCVDCGSVFPPEAMQWDHLPETEKRANLADLCTRGNRGLVLEELAKCELVCSNCHAVRTVRRSGA